MNNTNTRARIINEIFQTSEDPCNNDFSCYYIGSQNYIVPKYSVVSQHISDEPCPTDAFQWKPHVLFSENIQTLHETKHYTCKCENCRRDSCPSKSDKYQRKDNIMKFSDKGTMTLKLKDADCCCDFAKASKLPDVANTEHEAEDQNLDLKCYECKCPRAILKNNAYKCGGKICRTDDQIAERDTEEKVGKEESDLKEFMASEISDQRRTLYNEGISDQIANQFPIAPRILPFPICISNDQNCRAPIKKYNPKIPVLVKGIPYSHKIHSKYHNTCKSTSKSRLNYDLDLEDSKLVATPDIVKSGNLKSVRPVKVPIIRLPKKVLTSEKDVELYVDNIHPKSRRHR